MEIVTTVLLKVRYQSVVLVMPTKLLGEVAKLVNIRHERGRSCKPFGSKEPSLLEIKKDEDLV